MTLLRPNRPNWAPAELASRIVAVITMAMAHHFLTTPAPTFRVSISASLREQMPRLNPGPGCHYRQNILADSRDELMKHAECVVGLTVECQLFGEMILVEQVAG